LHAQTNPPSGPNPCEHDDVWHELTENKRKPSRTVPNQAIESVLGGEDLIQSLKDTVKGPPALCELHRKSSPLDYVGHHKRDHNDQWHAQQPKNNRHVLSPRLSTKALSVTSVEFICSPRCQPPAFNRFDRCLDCASTNHFP
jgi:hypothetical protein